MKDYMESTSAKSASQAFASRGSTRSALKDSNKSNDNIVLSSTPLSPIMARLKQGKFLGASENTLSSILKAHQQASRTISEPALGGASAGKNTYTYDAHTYHTKVPPQGIAKLIQQYLPEGGLVLDPFSGSGMTGVAARAIESDVILNELSPAASFISYNFTEKVSAKSFAQALNSVLASLEDIRKQLYTTDCRECKKQTEILYTVWSYKVLCPNCSCEFVLWDHCRKYGKSVKEHKVMSEFDCPSCSKTIKKSRLKRSVAVPVLLGYKCCSKKQIEHPLSEADIAVINGLDTGAALVDGYYPTNVLPKGVNLNQPRNHGIDTIDKFYTLRALTALSHLWKQIHLIEDVQLASSLAFAFTSLYQRVTKLSEFRFWGGSGNTAHFNVPYIYNEANIFVTFNRKASSILDHLETTASSYKGERAVVCNSATNLSYLPDESIDFIFTDPPFGANINYSEMNILWESWLGEFTDATNEAIMNKSQGKGLVEYEQLMSDSLKECYRVLRTGHWMLLVFMNSSAKVWDALKRAIDNAGFCTERVDIFDKKHGTFKQYVSANTAGADLIIHCRKTLDSNHQAKPRSRNIAATGSVEDFLTNREGGLPKTIFLHVEREEEHDMRLLYSEWLSHCVLNNLDTMDFVIFRSIVSQYITNRNDQ